MTAPTTIPTSARRTTLAGATALTVAVLPVFLVGASTDAIRAELGLSETSIGAIVTVMFVSGAVMAPIAGRLAERVGSGLALRAGVAIAGLGATAIGVLASGWWLLALPMVVVGLGMALIDTGAARAFSDRVPVGRQGFAFGIKEASIPTASLLAGLSLPSIAATLGWRATFLAGALVALAVLVALPAPRALRATHPSSVPAGNGRVASAATVRFAMACGLGTGAATSAATFLVPTVTDRGVAASTAGLVLSVASLTSIAARIGVGRWADGEGAAPVPAVSTMLVIGGVAAASIALDLPFVVLLVGACIVLGAGWGWTGLAFLAVVRANPHAPAVAAGVVLTGLGLGGALGPLAFGMLADRVSYGLAWAVVAASLLAGSVLAASARHDLAPVPVAEATAR